MHILELIRSYEDYVHFQCVSLLFSLSLPLFCFSQSLSLPPPSPLLSPPPPPPFSFTVISDRWTALVNIQKICYKVIIYLIRGKLGRLRLWHCSLSVLRERDGGRRGEENCARLLSSARLTPNSQNGSNIYNSKYSGSNNYLILVGLPTYKEWNCV